MSFKEALSRIGERLRERKDSRQELIEKIRMEKMAEDSFKSSNERELDKFINEEREKQIKQQLEVMRKDRQEDISFNHNPLNVKNITNHTDWEVLKEKNLFSANNSKSIFLNQKSILKSNNNLLKNNMRFFT